MPDVKQFKLPDVGEGLTEAEIVSWKVKPGDTVKVNDIVVEIETAKSLVELPSPFAGVVSELLVEQGRTVDVGTPIISVDTDPNGSAAPIASAASPKERPADDMSAGVASGVPSPKEDEAVEPGLIGGPAPGGRTSVLVGYGPRSTEAKRRPRKGTAVPEGTSAATAQSAVQTTAEPAPAPTPEPAVPDTPPSVPTGATAGFSGGTVSVLAKPPVRKLAKDLGVDLATVAPTGAGGIITRSDVEAAAGAAPVFAAPAAAVGQRETRIPIKGVRKMTAQAMVSSAFTAPHVTEFITIDMTASMELLEKLKARRDFAEVRLSPLVLVMKALLIAVARNPEINATWDEAAQEIVVKHHVNLGIAAATPRGLIVPNIKDAQLMTVAELANALGDLVATAREGKTQPADMAGGTITITNVGVFGVDTGTPILNPGESAILAFGAIRDMPWVVDGAIVPRKVTQLALSFDHRLVDGELGSRFLADLAAVLAEPELALAWS